MNKIKKIEKILDLKLLSIFNELGVEKATLVTSLQIENSKLVCNHQLEVQSFPFLMKTPEILRLAQLRVPGKDFDRLWFLLSI